MLTLLHPHPTGVPGPVSRISVTTHRIRRGLRLHFALEGNVAGLKLPPLKPPARADRLWEHLCFEAFVRAGESAAYTELNFSPSGDWAAYEFSDTRTGMRRSDGRAPQIELWSDSASIHVRADVEMPRLPEDEAWRLGLTAVVEEVSGAKSYWALAHRSAKPDFHHPGSFVLILP
jgi:hypothetical protein